MKFPRYVFNSDGSKTIVSGPDHHAFALARGAKNRVGKPAFAMPKEAPKAVQEPWTEEVFADAEEPLPSREELEGKAKELGLKYHPRLGDAKLAAMIEQAILES